MEARNFRRQLSQRALLARLVMPLVGFTPLLLKPSECASSTRSRKELRRKFSFALNWTRDLIGFFPFLSGAAAGCLCAAREEG